ncbi:hypothetical protein [Ideonella livida]|uniref:Acetyltransferase n=1 Tax=Ideonella livida TaxID=2707176 RepID=A0A7C9PEL9_9BURK|nr:hypothetical protein [Ideonella livida]NDY89956.1 hypothetical protein [Ideonella livida]
MIVRENKRGLVVRVTEGFHRLLQAHHVFQVRDGMGQQPGRTDLRRWPLGALVVVPHGCRLEPFCTLGVGDTLPLALGSFSSVMSELPHGSRVGRYCAIAADVSFMGFRHPLEAVTQSSAAFNGHREFMVAYRAVAAERDGQAPEVWQQHKPRQRGAVDLGHDVWLASGARVAGGVRIGNGAVVAAGAVVTRDVAPYSVVGGCPARPLRPRFPDAVCERLERLRWWERELVDLHAFNLGDPQAFCDALEAQLERVRSHQFSPLALDEAVRALRD